MKCMKKKVEQIEKLARNTYISEDFYAPTISDEFLSYLHGRKGGIYPRWLAAAIKILEPRIIVELGNREGLSTAAILNGLTNHNQQFYSIDIIEDLRYVSEKAKTDNRLKWVIGDCRDLSIFSHEYKIPSKVNFLFLDTIHTFEQVSSEFYVWEPLLANNCLVAIDDINLNDKGRFFDMLPYEKYNLTDLCHVSGFGIFFYHRTRPIPVEEAILRSSIVMANEKRIQEMSSELNRLKNNIIYRLIHKYGI